jgi:hypothetical protein
LVQEIWYNLSLLLPSLQRTGGDRAGIELIFQLLLQLPVSEIRYFSDLPQAARK